MRISKVEETKPFQNAHGVDARKIFQTQDAEVIHMALTAGQSLKKHTTLLMFSFTSLKGKVLSKSERKPKKSKKT